jgi:putative flavoprotein involved in K+ transport
MRRITTVVIGAGHAGLAMSRCLAERAIDHVVLERGEIANSWRTERWDSLRLLTPNWQSRLPGLGYEGDDPDGFRTMPEVVAFIDRYAQMIAAPVQTHTQVTSVRRTDAGYRIGTDRGDWQAATVVIASGACNIACVPKLADVLPSAIRALTPTQYRNPDELEPGGAFVIGASATGVQLADEIHRSGREVVLAVGEHIRVPRTYRGRDIQRWMDAAGVLDQRYDEVDDIARARRVPSLQLVGTPARTTLDLNALSDIGVRLVDRWATANGLDGIEPPHRFAPTRVPKAPPLALDLVCSGIRTIIWATGFRPDYGWLDVPVLDRKGQIRHDGGITASPGMYLMGMPFLRRRKSALIDGAGDDAHDLCDHLASYLRRQVAAPAYRRQACAA